MLNPNKMMTCHYLMQKFVNEGHKVIVFFDRILPMETLNKMMVERWIDSIIFDLMTKFKDSRSGLPDTDPAVQDYLTELNALKNGWGNDEIICDDDKRCSCHPLCLKRRADKAGVNIKKGCDFARIMGSTQNWERERIIKTSRTRPASTSCSSPRLATLG